ncbi:replicative DNA helicase [Hymenobacter guriensis]|uniref:Replicative DNA helicase n=1 Tax=Hymenobacter guriensis TaxID=2793065 RepID=A0ABS0L981_9BACT|nr:replicative DNA helicase [Hymenobacter guriensis]MBG8556183.1 replicative DNA helicase [Hymenobacter guriensis]
MNPLENYSHLPQNSIELERAVLGVMLTQPTGLREALELLRGGADTFYHPPHRPLFTAIQRLNATGKTVDYYTVGQYLAQVGKMQAAGGSRYIQGLLAKAPYGTGIADYCQYMNLLWGKRRVGVLMHQLTKDAADPTTDLSDLLASAYATINQIQEGLQVRGTYTLSGLLDQVAEEIVAATLKPGGITGIPSGLGSIDDVTGGWQPSDLIIVAARPGVGKTSFALANAVPAALAGYPGAIFNLEMSNTQMVRKTIATELGEYSTNQLAKGYFPSGGVEEARTIRDRVTRLEQAEIYLEDTPGLSIGEFRAKAARLKAEHDIRWIVVDYLQLMTGEKKGSREQEIGSISRGLKLTAKELNVPVIALSQLSRAVESRGGEKKPMLSDLRESGSIEQDADVVVFLYRPEYYKIKEDEMGESVADTTEVIFAKHRNGPLAEVIVGSTMKNGRYFDLEPAAPVAEPAPAEHFGPRILPLKLPSLSTLRTATASHFSDDGAPVS